MEVTSGKGTTHVEKGMELVIGQTWSSNLHSIPEHSNYSNSLKRSLVIIKITLKI